MATGNWNENNKPTIPGFYNRFKAAAEKRIGTGIHGIFAMPVKSNWGPVNKVISIKSEKELINTFGKDNTAFRLGRLALLGKPKEVLLYRLVDDDNKVATLKLKDTSKTDVLQLDTKFPTTRKFNITVKSNILDENKNDLVVFEDRKIIYTFAELSKSVDEIVEAINNNPENNWFDAKKLTESDKGLDKVVNVEFSGGNDGNSNITNEHYLKAMSVFETYPADGFAFDGITDSALQTSAKIWAKRNNEEGNRIIVFLGGKASDTIQQSNTKSKELNCEYIVNIGSSAFYEETKYSPAEVAVYIGALATGQKLKESICNAKTIFDDVEPRLNKLEIETALESGTLILNKDDDEVVVVDDVNTFKKYTEEKNETWGFIRAIKFMNVVDSDTAIKRKDFVGKVTNNKTGQLVLICALKQYFEILENQGVIEDFKVEIDEELQAKAKNDEVFWRWNAKYVNVMKKIFGTGYVR